MGTIRYEGGARVYRAPITTSTHAWTQMGELDPRVGLRVKWEETKQPEKYDSDGETPQLVKYFGVVCRWEGRFKTYMASDIPALYHSATVSGNLIEIGKSKEIGVTASGYAWAIKPPAGSSDTWGGYMYAGVNMSPADDPKRNTFGEFSKHDFQIMGYRYTTSKALMQWAMSSASSLLDDLP